MRNIYLTIDWKDKYTIEPWSHRFRGGGQGWARYFLRVATLEVHEHPEFLDVTFGVPLLSGGGLSENHGSPI